MHRNEDQKKDVERSCKQWKVILLGDGAVGKTSICQRFAGSGFSKQYKQTVGVDFFLKRLAVGEEEWVTMQLWDIGGQSLGSKMLRNYISGAHAVLLCYDMTSFDSFANLEDWHRMARSACNAALVGVIANKCDLSHMRVVKSQIHNRFADENGFHAFTMSAKSGDQVEACFLQVATMLAGREGGRMSFEGSPAVVPATIVEHARHDPNIAGGQVPPFHPKARHPHCVVS